MLVVPLQGSYETRKKIQLRMSRTTADTLVLKALEYTDEPVMPIPVEEFNQRGNNNVEGSRSSKSTLKLKNPEYLDEQQKW